MRLSQSLLYGQAVLISLQTVAGCFPWVFPCGHLAGALAQLGERLLCKQDVIGSIPIGSTKMGR